MDARTWSNWSGIVGLLCLLLAPGCARKDEWAGPQYGPAPRVTQTTQVYRLAVHPLYNPQKLARDYQPLIEFLNAHLAGAQFELEASRDYGAFEQKISAREPQFILPNPWQTLEAMKLGYGVLAMAGPASDFRGLILVRKDAGIGRVQDLRGRIVAYPAPTALAASMMPQLDFLEHGLNPMKDLDNRYVGTQESAILNVFEGLAAAGCTWPPPWRDFQKDHPREAAELRVAWETDNLINNSVMARADVPAALATRVQGLLLSLQDSPEGRAILKNIETLGFSPATDADYGVVRTFMTGFERRVRPARSKE